MWVEFDDQSSRFPKAGTSMPTVVHPHAKNSYWLMCSKSTLVWPLNIMCWKIICFRRHTDNAMECFTEHNLTYCKIAQKTVVISLFRIQNFSSQCIPILWPKHLKVNKINMSKYGWKKLKGSLYNFQIFSILFFLRNYKNLVWIFCSNFGLRKTTQPLRWGKILDSL